MAVFVPGSLDHIIVRGGGDLCRSPRPMPLPKLDHPRPTNTGTHPGGHRRREDSAAKLPRQPYAPRTLPLIINAR